MADRSRLKRKEKKKGGVMIREGRRLLEIKRVSDSGDGICVFGKSGSAIPSAMGKREVIFAIVNRAIVIGRVIVRATGGRSLVSVDRCSPRASEKFLSTC
ncbi:unnamed protein product [Ilex paraguariensis]|uniref:Uncharacterized protein n=1 Tax=Ilex paraguariensis TaxID=185542 RepID=A0ABC8S0M1_9AQUA